MVFLLISSLSLSVFCIISVTSLSYFYSKNEVIWENTNSLCLKCAPSLIGEKMVRSLRARIQAKGDVQYMFELNFSHASGRRSFLRRELCFISSPLAPHRRHCPQPVGSRRAQHGCLDWWPPLSAGSVAATVGPHVDGKVDLFG